MLDAKDSSDEPSQRSRDQDEILADTHQEIDKITAELNALRTRYGHFLTQEQNKRLNEIVYEERD